MRAALAGGSDSEPTPPPLVMESGIEVLLLRMEIAPEGVAAAGVSGSELQAALAAEEDELEAGAATLQAHDSTCAEARVTVDELRRKVKGGLATNEEIAQLATAKSTLATATAARAGFLDGLAADLLDNVPDASAATAQEIRTNRRWKQIPAAYRVEARTEAEWIEIRDALSARRTHEAIGDDVPQDVLAFLAGLDSSAEVAAAEADLEANLAGVQATWDSVFGG